MQIQFSSVLTSPEQPEEYRSFYLFPFPVEVMIVKFVYYLIRSQRRKLKFPFNKKKVASLVP